MKMKKIFICLMLMFAICVPIVEPGIVANNQSVVQAKTYSAKSIKKKYDKIKKGYTFEKAKKLFGNPKKVVNADTENGSTTIKYKWVFDCGHGCITIFVMFTDDKYFSKEYREWDYSI